jgi:hypothetical protein
MNVTIKEAENMFCPYNPIRYNTVNVANANDPKDIHTFVDTIGGCISNKCMMWEWNNKNKTTEKDKGHCGLINKI